MSSWIYTLITWYLVEDLHTIFTRTIFASNFDMCDVFFLYDQLFSIIFFINCLPILFNHERGLKGTNNKKETKSQSGSKKLLSPPYYCVQHIVPRKIECPHLLLIYISSTFACWHATVEPFIAIFIHFQNYVKTITVMHKTCACPKDLM